MQFKLSNKTKRLILIAVLILVAAFVVYSLFKNAQSPDDPQGSLSETVSIEAGTSKPTSKPNETVKPTETAKPSETAKPTEGGITVQKGQSYSDKDHVALYIHLYGELPPNYITKSQAEALGWVSSKGNLAKVAPGKSIGGDSFGNREGLLPKKNGRKYYECDIDYKSGTRNAKRIIYSNDGLVFYTEDHYESFTQLY